jgi:hypothetical protein
MGVDASFWASPATGVPKRKNRFLFEVAIGDYNMMYFCKTSGRPSYTVTEAEHRYLNHKFYYPGIVEWETIDVTLIDPVSPSAGKAFWNALGEMGWVLPSAVTISGAGTNGVISKANAGGGSIGTVNISALDAAGDVSEVWAMKNCWLKSVKFGDFDYSGDDLMDVTLTIRYDWAEFSLGTAASTAGDALPVAGAAVAGTS